MSAPASSLDATFAALADPTRRAILARLAAGEATVQELAAPFEISLPAISKHLKVLAGAGLITRGRDAQRRPCHLRAEALDDIAAWAEQTKRAWEERLDRLEVYLQELQSADYKQKTEGGDNERDG
ncbi:MAG: metalloregulator ArsR/SmtB family transcription factor [Rhodospirillaceae bacterium]|nr:metalloregulator ArsR/SmtB family transcription factor [Rhodospirillaceae bacterium]